MVDDQRGVVQVVETLDIVDPRPRREAGLLGQALIGDQLSEEQDLGGRDPAVADSGFPKGLDLAHGEGRLLGGAVDVADPFPLHGLHIPVHDQTADSSADRVPGAVVGQDQGVLRGQQLLVREVVGLDLSF